MKLTHIFALALCIAAFAHMYASEQKKPAQQPLSLGQSIVVGSASGATEVLISGQVLSYMTNQMGATPPRPISRNPLNWYTGTAANAVGMILPTAIQKTTGVMMTQAAEQAKGAQLANSERVGIAAGAGALSALALTPPEAVSTYMQDHNAKTALEHVAAKKAGQAPKISYGQAARNLGFRGAMRGIVPTMVRDAKFTVGYTVLVNMLTPAMQAQAKKHVHDAQLADVAGTIAGGISAGVVTAVGSQPAHVIKRALQGDPSRLVYTHPYIPSLEAAKSMYTSEGVKGFFKGGIPRGARVVCAIPILTAADATLTKAMQKE